MEKKPLINKKQPKVEKSTDKKENATSEIGFLWHKWCKLGQQKENNVFSSFFTFLDASFNCLKHFVGLENVLKRICQWISKKMRYKLNDYLE